ncbi:hypothetical protein T4C_9502, partial [Trichinella pseudospiralis]
MILDYVNTTVDRHERNHEITKMKIVHISRSLVFIKKARFSSLPINEVNWSEKIRNHEWIGRTLPDCVFHEILQKSHMKLKCDFNGGEWKRNQMCILKSYWQEVILLTLIKKFTMLSAKSW